MRTRRTVLAGFAATITLAGCSQQGSQSAGNQSNDASKEEFSLEDFRVDGDPPREYNAQFIAGASPEDAADEFSPQFSYTITGTSNDVETRLHVTHSPETIPKEELDETRQGETHSGTGEYQQNIALPDAVLEMFAETPRNLEATFRATETETDQASTHTFEMNYGDSYVERVVGTVWGSESLITSSTKLNSISVENDIIVISYESNNEIGTVDFDRELGGVSGFYTGAVEDVREPYELQIKATDANGDNYNPLISDQHARKYLNGEITSGEFANEVALGELPTSDSIDY